MGATSSSKRTEIASQDEGIPTLTEMGNPGSQAIGSESDEGDDDEDDREDDDIEIPDDASFTRNDVQIVMENTGCSRVEAVQELVANKGDLINTIMKLTPS